MSSSPPFFSFLSFSVTCSLIIFKVQYELDTVEILAEYCINPSDCAILICLEGGDYGNTSCNTLFSATGAAVHYTQSQYT